MSRMLRMQVAFTRLRNLLLLVLNPVIYYAVGEKALTLEFLIP